MNARTDIDLRSSLRGPVALRAWVSLALVVSIFLAVLHVHDIGRVPAGGRAVISSVHTLESAAQDKDCLLCLALRSTVLGAILALLMAVRVAYTRPLEAAAVQSLLRFCPAQPRAPPCAIR